ncbi:hypothetical protein Hanom_Chr12g01103461 [Helianthus anomalus]
MWQKVGNGLPYFTESVKMVYRKPHRMPLTFKLENLEDCCPKRTFFSLYHDLGLKKCTSCTRMFYISTFLSSKPFMISSFLWLCLHISLLQALILTKFDPEVHEAPSHAP